MIKAGNLARAAGEGDPFDGVLIRILDVNTVEGELAEVELVKVEVIEGDLKGTLGDWNLTSIVPLCPLEQLAREAE
jgi:hypothetical protein